MDFQSLISTASSGHPLLFGILNVTPDSFSDGGRYIDPELAIQHAIQLQEEGADVIDIGAESTRPSAIAVGMEEELSRLLPVIQSLKKQIRIPLSVDTTKSGVASAVLDLGVDIINDISGLRNDPELARVVARNQAGLILMHSRGTPQTMQQCCDYRDLIPDILQEWLQQYRIARDAGVPDSNLALDPGIGFAKTRDQNFLILDELEHFTQPSPLLPRPFPVMIGVSRKSFLGGEVASRGAATVSAELAAWKKGAAMIRTHDVAAIHRALAAESRLK